MQRQTCECSASPTACFPRGFALTPPHSAGGAVESISGVPVGSLGVPPVAVVLNQELVQRQLASKDGEKKTESYLEREVLALTCSTDLQLVVFEAKVRVESPAARELRRACVAASRLFPAAKFSTLPSPLCTQCLQLATTASWTSPAHHPA